MEYVLDLAPLIAIILGLLGLMFWWRWRTKRKEEREHSDALSTLTATLGGKVVGREEARAWTADLLPPMKSDTEGFIGWLGTVRRPRFETALDFRRDGWSVRVSEASMEQATSDSSNTFYEHRIEVATSPLPAMKMCRRLHEGFLGRPPTPAQAEAVEPAGEPPTTAVREQLDWLPVGLPEPANREFTVFSTDAAAVSRAFTPQVAEWLVAEAGPNPFQSPMPILLTFEAGFAYTTASQRIDPDHLLARVDIILGLLNRMGATPAIPPVTT
ncbi:hypothetical protein ACFFSW_07670 [Saccharothrix longispora]|uniref:Uncharacterized protein n=1 Tax=Saccharothrix longispora TaxID=33920 RepID=A0ABU1PM76_9PSEU|nr:hypothetical protein [Saccharothrix longispora]MDR6591767.1 hypothetical protein [Saccharothrix longispora]